MSLLWWRSSAQNVSNSFYHFVSLPSYLCFLSTFNTAYAASHLHRVMSLLWRRASAQNVSNLFYHFVSLPSFLYQLGKAISSSSWFTNDVVTIFQPYSIPKLAPTLVEHSLLSKWPSFVAIPSTGTMLTLISLVHTMPKHFLTIYSYFRYHDMADVLDFFVLKQYYDQSLQRDWRPGRLLVLHVVVLSISSLL